MRDYKVVTFKSSLLLMIVIICFFLLQNQSRSSENLPSLYITFPSLASADRFQKLVQSKCSNVNVKVFSKNKDFNRAQNVLLADAIININLDNNVPGYQHSLQGINGTSAYEQYVLITEKKKINTKADGLQGKIIAVVEFLSNQTEAEVIKGLLDADVEVLTLQKIKDIKPILFFKEADAVFAPQRIYLEQKKRTKGVLVANQINSSVKLVSLSIREKKYQKKIQQCVKNFDDEINYYMGVDAWR